MAKSFSSCSPSNGEKTTDSLDSLPARLSPGSKKNLKSFPNLSISKWKMIAPSHMNRNSSLSGSHKKECSPSNFLANWKNKNRMWHWLKWPSCKMKPDTGFETIIPKKMDFIILRVSPSLRKLSLGQWHRNKEGSRRSKPPLFSLLFNPSLLLRSAFPNTTRVAKVKVSTIISISGLSFAKCKSQKKKKTKQIKNLNFRTIWMKTPTKKNRIKLCIRLKATFKPLKDSMTKRMQMRRPPKFKLDSFLKMI